MALKIDQDRMANGKAVAKELRGGGGGGIPWMVILDGDGKQLVTSDGPKGNIGCPIQPHERAFFYEMLAKTRKHMSDEEAGAVKAGLEAFAKAILDKRRR
ncbi:MAG: hypothetical protein HRU14_03270 [Planctomycetes bacterium]|nr:hypothetical protein [Planctomycetota bacterium]